MAGKDNTAREKLQNARDERIVLLLNMWCSDSCVEIARNGASDADGER